MTKISYALQEAALSANLYHTGGIKKAITSLYIDVITFFIKVAKWYKKHRLTRLISAIAKPFQLDYRDTLEKIRVSSEIIEGIAAGQSRAELRIISTATPLMRADIERMRVEIEEIARVQACQTTILRGIQISIQEIQPRIYDLQYGDVVAALKPSIEPTEMLYTNQLLLQRRKSKLGPSYNAITHTVNLHKWANSPSSSLLVLQPNAGADFTAKEISVDIINHLRAANKPIFWSLSALPGDQPVISTETILKTLLFQVTKATTPKALMSAFSPQGLSVANASACHSEREWLEILKCSIAQLVGDCFVVVECADLYHVHSEQPRWAQAFLTLFHALADGVQGTGSRVKVLVVNSDKSGAGLWDRTGDSPRMVAPVQRSPPLRPELRKRRTQATGRVRYSRAHDD